MIVVSFILVRNVNNSFALSMIVGSADAHYVESMDLGIYLFSFWELSRGFWKRNENMNKLNHKPAIGGFRACVCDVLLVVVSTTFLPSSVEYDTVASDVVFWLSDADVVPNGLIR